MIPDEGPSQRPYETLTPLAAKLGLSIDARHGKNHYAKMVMSALACDGAVLEVRATIWCSYSIGRPATGR